MLDELPQQLKSGRELAATAGGGNVGLYTFPGLDDDYRVVTKAGQVWAGDGDGVPDPPEGRWRWIKTDDGDIVDEAVPSAADDEPRRPAVPAASDAPSATHLCIDCGVDVRTLSHGHSRRHPTAPGTATVCCMCVRQAGLVCGVAA